ncbi:hypothetical protein Q1695_005475 [Nippostrongylus brasiliensis]|nr:hypothetical protein Q1695_005475 [Nippostrongylus brasiliensis]
MKSTVIHDDGQTMLTTGEWPTMAPAMGLAPPKKRRSWRDPVPIPLWTVFLPCGVLFLVICLISALHHIRITNLELRMRSMESRLAAVPDSIPIDTHNATALGRTGRAVRNARGECVCPPGPRGERGPPGPPVSEHLVEPDGSTYPSVLNISNVFVRFFVVNGSS